MLNGESRCVFITRVKIPRERGFGNDRIRAGNVFVYFLSMLSRMDPRIFFPLVCFPAVPFRIYPATLSIMLPVRLYREAASNPPPKLGD